MGISMFMIGYRQKKLTEKRPSLLLIRVAKMDDHINYIK